MSQQLSSQCYSSIDEYEQYFSQNEDLDPIEGIWILNVERSLYQSGQLIDSEFQKDRSEWAIVKDNDQFKVCDIGKSENESNSNNFKAIFKPTNIEGFYNYECQYFDPNWKGTSSVRLTDNSNLEYNFFVGDKMIKKYYGKNAVKHGVQLKWSFFWTKKYPSPKIGLKSSNRPTKENISDEGVKKIYYSDKWKVVSSREQASYMRLANKNSFGAPVGKIIDYYISGEQFALRDGAIYIDPNEDKNSIFYGKTVGYFKSGEQYFETIRDEKGIIQRLIEYFENGNINRLLKFKEGKIHDERFSFHPNGKIKQYSFYDQGYLVGDWFLDCDFEGSCHKVFSDNFIDNSLNWNLETYGECSSLIDKDIGLLLNTGNTCSSKSEMKYLVLNEENDFSLELNLKLESGVNSNAFGILWGYKDNENYSYFYINKTGEFKIGSYYKGLHSKESKWSSSQFIDKNDFNILKISKFGSIVVFSINREVVYQLKYLGLLGDFHGIGLIGSNADLIVQGMEVKESLGFIDFDKSPRGEWNGNGSGFFIEKSGFIVTNHHVIENAEEIQIEFQKNGILKSHKAEIVVSDKERDLAILKIIDEDFRMPEAIPYNFTTNQSDVGSEIFVLGYPLALSGMGEEIKFTDGKVSSLSGYNGNKSAYQISAPVQPGNSGGPLIDYNGNLVGIVNSGILKADNVSYAIKSFVLGDLLKDAGMNLSLPNNNSVSRMPLTEKIKIISEYVVLVKVK